MSSNWLSNSNSIERVKTLLEQAGLPLELSVERICQEYCDLKSSNKDLLVTSEKIVYASRQNPQEYREVDRLVQIYEEFPVNKLTGIQLNVSIPIECKYRRDLETFAFPLRGCDPYKRFPLHSVLSGSQYFATLIGAFEFFSKIPFCSLIFVEIKNGETPQEFHEEKIAYNAAGALYDFIFTETTEDGESKIDFGKKIIEETNLIAKFARYINETNYHWKSSMNRWIANVSKRQNSLFNQKYFGGQCVYYYIGAHIPVICLDSPIHFVTWVKGTGIEKFEEIPYCMTSIRKHGWPGAASLGMMSFNPEVPVIVTNPANLDKVLELGYVWHKELHSRLATAPIEIINRWALESSLSSAIIRHFGERDFQMAYRSDYDFGP